MKKFFVFVPVLFSFLLLLNACKKDPNIAEILKIVQELRLQNDNLKAELVKQSDRLDALLQMMNGTNQQVTDLVKKIDAVSKEIASILVQIDALNKELKNTDADVAKILEQIAVLQKQSADLVAQINQLTAIPAAPTLLQASATENTITLTWKDNSNNEIGFKIERLASPGLWEQIAVVDANITSYTVMGTSYTTGYIFRVSAYNLGMSPFSNIVTITGLTEGLLGYYPFNGNTNDASVYNNHLINSGAVLTTDKIGGASSAYRFTGNSSRLTSSSSPSPQNFSVSLWFKVLTSWSYTTLNLFSISRDSDSQYGGFSLRLDQNDLYGSGKYKFFALSNANEIRTSTTYSFSELSQWNHIVLVKNGTEISIFFNNTLIGRSSFSGTIDYTSTLVQIGNKRNLNNNPLGERVIDEVRLYSRALSSSEITYLYQNY